MLKKLSKDQELMDYQKRMQQNVWKNMDQTK